MHWGNASGERRKVPMPRLPLLWVRRKTPRLPRALPRSRRPRRVGTRRSSPRSSCPRGRRTIRALRRSRALTARMVASSNLPARAAQRREPAERSMVRGPASGLRQRHTHGAHSSETSVSLLMAGTTEAGLIVRLLWFAGCGSPQCPLRPSLRCWSGPCCNRQWPPSGPIGPGEWARGLILRVLSARAFGPCGCQDVGARMWVSGCGCWGVGPGLGRPGACTSLSSAGASAGSRSR